MARKQRNPDLESHWRRMLERQQASGLTVRVFCRQERLVETSFHYWRRTIRRRDLARPLVPSPAPAFVPAVVRTDPSPAGPAEPRIALDLRGGRVLQLPVAMPVARVAELVHAIEGDVAGSPAEVAS